MAWLATDKNEKEYIYEEEPMRSEDENWISITLSSFIELPRGTIAKLLRYDLKWEDEPVELK